jgi:hypothetical protein
LEEEIFFHVSEFPRDKVPEVGDEVRFRVGTRNHRLNCQNMELLPTGTIKFTTCLRENVDGIVQNPIVKSRDRETKQKGTIAFDQ